LSGFYKKAATNYTLYFGSGIKKGNRKFCCLFGLIMKNNKKT